MIKDDMIRRKTSGEEGEREGKLLLCSHTSTVTILCSHRMLAFSISIQRHHYDTANTQHPNGAPSVQCTLRLAWRSQTSSASALHTALPRQIRSGTLQLWEVLPVRRNADPTRFQNAAPEPIEAVRKLFVTAPWEMDSTA